MIDHSPASPAPDAFTTKPGRPYPLGATPDEQGVNFALFSENGTAVHLCLYDAADPSVETARISLTERTENVWHIYVEGLLAGQLYGYRVEGPYEPQQGHYFNPNKLLLDPYARAIYGDVGGNNAQLGYDYQQPADDRFLHPNPDDSGPTAPKGVVIDPAFDWEGDQPPLTPLHRSVVYEMHVKGFTEQQPHLSEAERGTYAGIAHPESVAYLKKLGVTAVELLPVHQFSNESYWGYNSIGFFAPHNGYATDARGQQVAEFKTMVKALHQAGIEVILDVVYNHTAEGNQFGPTLSLKGIDNKSYYKVVPDQPQYYMDYSGTGNTLDLTHARTLQLVMDSLRYWVTEMHVDGFRFDLASALLRGTDDGARIMSSFLDTVAQDPVLAPVKLIAEPWDIGSYHVGQFPIPWSEWNGKYRDCVRAFWKGDEGKAFEMGLRLLGSPELYSNDGRAPGNSINLITAHDGFTLRDLVSYNEKHNEANGEDNRDGHNDNLSWNCGVEGPTDDPAINDLRERQQRNFLATLFLSQGTPMLLMGDECGRTQQGNNNAYCQDNDISWMSWNWNEAQQRLFNFTSQLTALRQQFPLLRRRKFYTTDEIAWVRPDGRSMTERDWHNGQTRCLALLIDGAKVTEQDEDGNEMGNEKLLWICNSYWENLPFKLPTANRKKWHVLVNTADGLVEPKGVPIGAMRSFVMPARATMLLQLK